jgi:hypothetical protein
MGRHLALAGSRPLRHPLPLVAASHQETSRSEKDVVLLLAQGINVKVISEMLGHADASITLRVYAHVMPHMQQQAADAMDGHVRAPGQHAGQHPSYTRSKTE